MNIHKLPNDPDASILPEILAIRMKAPTLQPGDRPWQGVTGWAVYDPDIAVLFGDRNTSSQVCIEEGAES